MTAAIFGVTVAILFGFFVGYLLGRTATAFEDRLIEKIEGRQPTDGGLNDDV